MTYGVQPVIKGSQGKSSDRNLEQGLWRGAAFGLAQPGFLYTPEPPTQE